MNFKDIYTNQKYNFAFAGLLFVFILVKIPFLNLPFYWDEAWVYGPAARTMAMQTPSLMPDAISSDLSRGHPALYVFTVAIWLKIWGNTPENAHIFALLLSIVLLFSVYKITANTFHPFAGILATALCAAQPVFLAQSGMVLPEVQVALFSLLSLYFYSKDKIPQVSFFLAALLLTKESGVALLGTFYIFELYKIFTDKKIIAKRAFLLLLPLLSFTAFLFLQRVQLGWFFYPEHTDLMNFDFSIIHDKFMQYFSFTFIYQGRNVLFFAGVLFAIIIYLKNRKPIADKQFVYLWLVFTMLYLAFSSVNFYSARYSLCIIIPFLIVACVIIGQAVQNKIFKAAILLGLIAHFILVNLQRRDNSDQTLGYADCVKLQQEAVIFCMNQNLYESKIYGGFLIRNSLTNTLAGYIERPFLKVSKIPEKDCEYFIYSNFEDEEMPKELTKLKSWQKNQFEIGIYRNQ